jgi:hypothetical protein
MESDMSRGIVIGQRINSNSTQINGSIETEDIVRWLLYWDKIAYAGLGLNGASISGNHSASIKYLESLGVFSSEIVDIQSLGSLTVPKPEPGITIMGVAGNQFPIVAAATRIKLCKTLSEKTGNIWTLGQSGSEELALSGIEKSKELLDIRLNSGLPVPSEDTPFEDILNFKEKHKAELERLRYALDVLRENVLSSNDERRALDLAMREISISLADMNKAMSSSGINVLTQAISLYTENPSISFWSALGGVIGASQGIPYEVSAGAGIAIPTAFTFIKRNVLGGHSLPTPESDFSYAFKVSTGVL